MIAGCCALAAFAIAIVAGLAASNTTDVILARAIISMFVCYIVGAIVGHVGERAVQDWLATYKEAHAIEMAEMKHVPIEEENLV